MDAGALSMCAVTSQLALSYGNQKAYSAHFSLSNLYVKVTRLPCTFQFKMPFSRAKSVQFLMREKGYLAPKHVPFAVPNENDEHDKGAPHICSDEQSLSPLENNEGSKNLKIEAKVPLLNSLEDYSQNAVNARKGDLLHKLQAVHLQLLATEQWNASKLKQCHRNYLVSATNLIHYLGLTSLGIEQLKEDLSSIGLLNLEIVNPYVLYSLSAAIQMLENLKFNTFDRKESVELKSVTEDMDKQKKIEFTMHEMRKRASSNQDLLLGSLHGEKTTHIMVTVGQEALENKTLIIDLLKRGTTIMRINCAHGNASVWSAIIRRVKRGSRMLEKPCRILMDLAGPKLRTGKMKPGPCVMKLKPKKNACGNVVFPAQVWLSPKGAGPAPAHLSFDTVLYVDGHEFLSKLEVGDVVTFSDARGKERAIKISKKFPVFSGVGFIAECTKTAYVLSGTKLYIKGSKRKPSKGFVVDIPPVEEFVRVRIGDLLIISRESSDEQDGTTSAYSTSGTHRITCSSGYLFDSVKPGESIAFDDGKIWGVIKGTTVSEIVVSITHASPRGAKLGSEKSINIPESNIQFEGLTSKDLMDLDFVASYADMVGVSFIRDVSDIIVLRQELAKRKLQNLGIVLKIETVGGYEKLPLLLLEAMKSHNPLGVMIARGDLAVECGWEKLASIQEEILSICSAAHIPVIWATQVLESLIKTGLPTRSEITDVAAGRRTSCIMLNKGKHILEGVVTLHNILYSSSPNSSTEFRPFALSSNVSQSASQFS